MKIVVTCGNPSPALASVGEVLHSAGVAQSRPSRQDASVTIATWHERLLAGRAASAEALRKPGKAWEQILGDIFVANWEQPCWGWTVAASTWLLNYFKTYDSEFRFVLVFQSPQAVLRGVLQAASPADAEPAMQAWLACNRELLRFYNRNADVCVLAEAEACLADVPGLIDLCNRHLGLSLEAAAGGADAGLPDNSGLAAYFAAQLISSYSEAQALYLEMQASAHRVVESAARADVADPGSALTPALEELGRLRQLQAANAAMADRQGELEADLAAIRSEAESLRTAQAASRSENEQLLLQLHQVQEELESQFLKAQEAAKQLGDERTKALAGQEVLQKQLDQLKAAPAQPAADPALTQKLKVSEEERAKLTAARDQLQKQVTQLQGEVQAAKAAAGKARADDEARKAREEADKAAVAHKELQQENELILLQLYQVQEELESYFLKHQELKQQTEEQETRWKRLLARQPQYCDWASLTLRVVSQPASPQDLEWRFKDFAHGGRTLPALTVRTVVRDRPGLLVVREQGAEPPLLRWPPGKEHSESVFLAPADLAKGQRERHELLLNLSSGDWALLPVLLTALSDALRAGQFTWDAGAKADKTALDFWGQALADLQRDFAALPPVFRYDAVELMREQVNPDYEHLALRFSGVAIGKQRWSSFEYRISAADVGPNRFDDSPKLEFPLQQGNIKPLESWYEESRDDFGAKTELRFKPALKAMDLEVWSRLSAADQKLVTSLAGRMPYVLALMEHHKVVISRAWNDWKRLMAGVIAVLREHVGGGASSAAQRAPAKSSAAQRAPAKSSAVEISSAAVLPMSGRKKPAVPPPRRGGGAVGRRGIKSS